MATFGYPFFQFGHICYTMGLYTNKTIVFVNIDVSKTQQTLFA